MNRFFYAAAFGLTLASPVGAASLSDLYTSVFFLGDSLSDDGNIFARTDAFPVDNSGTPPPPYFDGRFSDGLVFTDLLGAEFGTTENYAFGGARATLPPAPNVPDHLPQQLSAFFGDTVTMDEGDRPLVSIWLGANDIFQAFDLPGDPVANALGAASAAASAVVAGIQEIANDVNSDVNDFVVMNLPDIGASAQFAAVNFNDPDLSLAQAAGLQGIATAASQAYNAQLAAELAVLGTTGLNIVEVDIFSLFAELQSNPDLYGLINTTTPCLYTDPDTVPLGTAPYCGPALSSQYLFFDGVHPSSTVHAILAGRITELAAVPVPAGLPMMAMALLGIGLLARRRAAA